MNPNQLREYGMTVQENNFSEALIFISKEDPDFMLPLSSKGTILGVTTITSTENRATDVSICYLFVGA